MKKLTAQEILNILKENCQVEEFAYDDVDYKSIGLGEVKEVEQYGGTGKGDTWYSVKHFIDHDVYIRIDGYYQSHYGTDFNDGYGGEVKPVKKTITVYE